MLICEMAAYYRNRGMSLYEGLQEVFRKYGYFIEGITSFTLEGKEGLEKINTAMDTLRSTKSYSLEGCRINAVRDYLAGTVTGLADGNTRPLDLPASNVLYYELDGGAWFCIRPSGTEPKIKIYYGVSEKTPDMAKQRLELIKDSVTGMIRKLLHLD
jgi:phosphoglucomutase